MKLFVRAFALALVATGTVASLHASASSSPVAITGQISAPPVPMCPPNDPNACGIDKLANGN